MALRQALAQRLFRFGRDEQLPVVLTQRRIFILPTGAGLLYAAVLCAMLIGAINYNLSLGHALVFLLAGLGLVAMVHTFRNLLGLRIALGEVEHGGVVEAGGAGVAVRAQRGKGIDQGHAWFSSWGRRAVRAPPNLHYRGISGDR